MDPLVEAAIRALDNACAPYSGFRVGAALEDAQGRIWTGCNIENATLGLTLCAERVALCKALSEGARRFRRLAVVAASPVLTPPCGACRQLLWEYAGDLEIVLADGVRATESLRLRDLLPRAFDASHLRR
ncbi:MAG: cytidine deaminase [Bryobacterales bacterium]|nr:cytidine deaminase [Bryobacteraceae bacterium]MDW8129939.1 cytidine deaminase [Bryobacterales bacterium]